MGPLKRRSSSVSETTFVATTTILLIFLVVAIIAFIITFFRQRNQSENVALPLTPSNSRSFSRINRTHQHQQASNLPAQRPRQSFNARSINPASISDSYLTATSNLSLAPPTAPTRSYTTLRPYTPNLPPSSLPNPNSPPALRRDALIAKLSSLPLTSDTTDDTAPTDEPRPELLPQAYKEWVAKRRPGNTDPVAAMLIGSDEGTTDAGGGEVEGGYRGFLDRGNRGFGGGGDEEPWERGRGSEGQMGWGNSRVGSGNRWGGDEDEEPLTPRPLPLALRRMRSDPYS